ncbi:MAG: protein-glutamine gamma-glutamyltransferase [Thermoleophilaceae bacterium]|nr:protein-glutamine gamma-glutamyltransferase [Thermoleophilaceae bacterium]
MSTAAAPAPATTATPTWTSRQPEAAAHTRLELPLRLVSFFALAVFCSAHYSVLVSHASPRRVVGAAAAATLGGLLLALTAGMQAPRPVRVTVRTVLALATLAATLVITGLAARLLLPWHWHELGDGLSRGFDGLDSFTWPYSGADAWVRLTLLLGLPLLLAPAAVLAFWPAPRVAGVLRWCALALLLVAYGTGVTELGLGGWALRGAALLVVIAAWLWLPRLRPRDTLPATLAVLGCGLLALPLAASFDRDAPWLDYRHWNWFQPQEAGTRFQWDHSYGPIQWSRTGITLLQVKASQPHYWKAETLDRFDGIGWFHSDSAFKRGDSSSDIPQPMNPRWVEHITFTVRRLDTSLVVGAGTTFSVNSDKVSADEPDGTVRVLDPPIEQGDTYSVDSYVPDPTAGQMRAAPSLYPQRLISYTAFDLPAPNASGLNRDGPSAADTSRAASDRTVAPVIAGEQLQPQDVKRVLESPYARTYDLARRLAAGRPTTYDTVKSVESYLQRGFQYSEHPPLRRYPLSSFLFDDRIGYCQQFSGAMALMLRMDGIPARVAAGFTPGAYDHVAKEYRVRDLDAHSWVEVWFTGIGWVPFDPTPSLAPASSQSDSLNAVSAARGTSADHGSTDPRKKLNAGAEANGGSGSGSTPTDSRLWLLALVVLAIVVVALAVLWLLTFLRRRSRVHGTGDGAVDELRVALERLGYSYPARTTLSELERRLKLTAGPAAARYVGLLSQQRYARPGASAPPTARDRRELRRALTGGGGPIARLRGLLALPPHVHSG